MDSPSLQRWIHDLAVKSESFNQAYVLLNKPAYDDSEPQSKPLSVERMERGTPWSTVPKEDGGSRTRHTDEEFGVHMEFMQATEKSLQEVPQNHFRSLPVSSGLSSHHRSKKLAGVGALCQAYCILDCVLCTPKPNQITSWLASTVAAKPPLSPVPMLAPVWELHRATQQRGSKKNAAMGAYRISWILSWADYTSEAEAEPHYGFFDLLLILHMWKGLQFREKILISPFYSSCLITF